jgi:isocitrate dehydrogenase (NAD+)
VIDNIVDRVTPEAIASLKRTGVGLKGEFVTGVGRGTLPSINIDIRRSLSLYANIVHSINIPGIASRHSGVDIVIIRENTEGEYSGMEHEVAPGVTESLKVMTRDATRRIAAYAFEYAHMNNRAKVTAVHKANIMKKADGIFLESCADVAKAWPHIQYEEVIVDNCMMQLVSKPQQFDVMVTPNFYGSLVSNAVAGLMGGPGVAPGVSLGAQGALFEQGARHVGMDIRGKDVANPSSILFASVMLLRYLKMPNFADRMEAAIFATCVRVARGARAREAKRSEERAGTPAASHAACHTAASLARAASLPASRPRTSGARRPPRPLSTPSSRASTPTAPSRAPASRPRASPRPSNRRVA